MALLNPAALFFLALVPALVLAYLVREHPARVPVSSVLALRALQASRSQRLMGRPRLSATFFVELLILLLAVLAMAEPYMVRRENPVAVVLDNSAAMQARSTSGQTRFEQARKQLLDAISKLGESPHLSLFVTAPEPHQLPSPLQGFAAARSAIGAVKPTDAPADPIQLARLLNDLLSGKRFGKVIFAGATPIAPPLPQRLSVLAAGAPLPNYAIGSFVLRRELLGRSAFRGRLTVANFSRNAASLKVTVRGDGRLLSDAPAHLEAQEVASLEFPALPPAQVYRADLSPQDGFALDNTAYATASSARAVSVIFVSPTPSDGAGLASLPGVALKTVSPESFSPRGLADTDLAIFEYAVPKQLPPVNSLLVMPPPGDPVFGFSAEPVANPLITGWSATNPLTDSVNFRLLKPGSGQLFAPHPWMAPVVSGTKGALLLAGQRQGHRYVATGFNPFPYLGRRNLPMSVLTLNLLSFLASVGTDTVGYHTGQPWLVPAGIEKIRLPSGEELSVNGGELFGRTSSQGVYTLMASDGTKWMRAVNLADLALSDFYNPTPIRLEPQTGAGPSAPVTAKAALDSYVLALLIAIGLIEVLWVYRRRRLAPAAGP